MKGSVISAAANTNTKNIDAPANEQPNSIASIANMNVGADDAKKAAPAPNSLAAKAGLVAQYNQEHGDQLDENEVMTPSGTKRRKYKK